MLTKARAKTKKIVFVVSFKKIKNPLWTLQDVPYFLKYNMELIPHLESSPAYAGSRQNSQVELSVIPNTFPSDTGAPAVAGAAWGVWVGRNTLRRDGEMLVQLFQNYWKAICLVQVRSQYLLLIG